MCLALNFHFARQFFSGFGVLFADLSEKRTCNAYCQVFQNNAHWCLLKKFSVNLICIHLLQFSAHVLGNSFTHCVNKVNLIFLKFSPKKCLPNLPKITPKKKTKQTNKQSEKKLFCTTTITLFIHSNTGYI